jgi:uncharacterized membrane protein
MGKASRSRADRRELIRRENDRATRAGSSSTPPPDFAISFQGTRFRGPLPPPEILAKYEALLPGASERIFSMAERNQSHRQSLEMIVIPGLMTNERIGQVVGAVVFLGSLGIGAWCIYRGSSAAGVTEMIATSSIFAGLYLKSQAAKQRDLQEKRSPTQQ